MRENMSIELTEEQIELGSKLTPLQRRFVLKLMKDGYTQRKAYIEAGGTAKTENAQDEGASKMLRNPKVAKFHKSLVKAAATSAVMTKEQALERLTMSAQVKITDVCDFRQLKVGEDEDGNDINQTVWTMKNSEDIPPHVAACIKSVTVTKDGPKIELYDNQAAIKQLSEILGWKAATKTELSGEIAIKEVTRTIID